MSRITINFILRILRIASKLISRALSHLVTVIDIIDDGVANGSYEAPDWMEKLMTVCDELSHFASSLSCLTFDVSESPVEASENE